MQFDLNMHTVCIGPTEPAFLAAVFLGVVAAFLCGRGLGRLDAGLRDRWRRFIYLPVLLVGSGLALFVGTAIATHLLYRLGNPGVELCTAFVWPGFVVPVVVMSMVSGHRAKKQSEPQSAGAQRQTADGPTPR